MTKLIILGVTVALLALAHPELTPYLSLIASMCGYGVLWYVAKSLTSERGQKTVLFLSFATIYAVHFAWLARPEYHGFAILILYALLVLFYAFSMTALSLIMYRRAKDPFRALFPAALFVFFEWGMSRFLCGFTIDQIGLHLLWHPIAAQTSAFLGGFFLTFLVIYTNILIYISIAERSMRQYALLSILLPYLFGIPQYYLKEKAAKGAGQLQVGIIQTGLRPEEKRPLPGRIEKFMPIHAQWLSILSQVKEIKKAKLIDFIVLPEAALPFGYAAPCLPLVIAEKIISAELGDVTRPMGDENIVQTYDGPYVTNGYLCRVLSSYLDTTVIAGLIHENGPENYSCAFAFHPGNKEAEMYKKRVLVPIAEGAPFSFMRSISEKYGISEYFTPGTSYQPFSGPVQIVPNICYEEMRSDLIKKYSTDLQVFVNLTNDVWYPNSTLPQRHYTHAKLRAIENGVPYVRSCNTGVSAAISPTGKEITRVANEKGETEWIRGNCIGKLPAISYATPYAKYGDSPLFLLLGGVIVLDLLLGYKVSQRLKKIMSIKH